MKKLTMAFHRKSWPCLHQQCAGVSFARYADLQRHVAVIHNRSTLLLVDCQERDCHRKGQYGFTRKDKMVDHMREVHKLDIPKQRRRKSQQQ